MMKQAFVYSLLLVLVYLNFINCHKHLYDAVSLTNLDGILRERFAKIRNHNVNETEKKLARDYIIERFTGFGFNITQQAIMNCDSNTTMGLNIMGFIPGPNFGKKTDKVYGILTHYDTVATSPGVDDNGAAMAALIDIARVMSNKIKFEEGCTFKHTLLFAAVDFEEGNLCGSERLVKAPWFNDYYAEQPNFAGTVVLDTIMNFNDSEYSQTVPQGFSQAFPDAYQRTYNDTLRGNFLTMISRGLVPAERSLVQAIQSNWGSEDKYKLMDVSIPQTTDPVVIINTYRDLVRSDHINLWAIGLPAIFLTDSANFRGSMQKCYHQQCDNADTMINNDNIGFLLKTANTLVSVLTQLAEGSSQCTPSAATTPISSSGTTPISSSGTTDGSSAPFIAVILMCAYYSTA